MADFLLGKRLISDTCADYYIIAEVGVNHEGNLELAKKQIELAKEGGADAVKFQTYKANRLASKHSPAYWDTSKESTKSQFELFQKYDSFGESEYRELRSHSEKVGIEFMSTAFDLDSLRFIDPMVNAHKVASADLTNIPLLRAIAITGKPLILSTGAASFVEVSKALEVLNSGGAKSVALLHCVLNYPTPDHRAYLGRITKLLAFYPDLVCGYSDHTLPGDFCFPVVVAYTLGARIIEKHFTHDKTLPGNDHYHAMNCSDLKGLRFKLDQVRSLMGSTNERDFLEDQQSAISHARRSIVVDKNLTAGATLSNSNLTVKRPGTGISPFFWDEVIGKKLLKDLPEDSILNWRDFSP